MMNRAEIDKVLRSLELTEPEKWVIKWQFGLLGDFQTALSAAIKSADETNLARLELGFPVQVGGFREWAFGGMGTRLRERGVDI